MVGCPLDRGPHPAQASRGWRVRWTLSRAATQSRYNQHIMVPKGLWPLAAASLACAVACGGDARQPPPATPQAGAENVDAATAGVIAGRVIFQGTPPENRVLKLSGDPA